MKKIVLGLVAMFAASLAPPATAQIIRTVQGDRCSGTVTASNVSQIASAGDSSRGWLVVQNPIGAIEPLYVDFGPNHLASPTLSIALAPGGSVSFLSGVVPVGQINVTAATAGHAFICETGR